MQINGGLIAASVGATSAGLPSNMVFYNPAPFTGCVPKPSETRVSLTALCVDPDGNLTLRLRNP